MKKIQIKGKDYIEVNERVKQFHIDYPNGSNNRVNWDDR